MTLPLAGVGGTAELAEANRWSSARGRARISVRSSCRWLLLLRVAARSPRKRKRSCLASGWLQHPQGTADAQHKAASCYLTGNGCIADPSCQFDGSTAASRGTRRRSTNGIACGVGAVPDVVAGTGWLKRCCASVAAASAELAARRARNVGNVKEQAPTVAHLDNPIHRVVLTLVRPTFVRTVHAGAASRKAMPVWCVPAYRMRRAALRLLNRLDFIIATGHGLENKVSSMFLVRRRKSVSLFQDLSPI